jgi:hypothetical protein
MYPLYLIYLLIAADRPDTSDRCFGAVGKKWRRGESVCLAFSPSDITMTWMEIRE